MTDVAVIIPWRGGCRHRAAALEWAQRSWAAEHDTYRQVVAEVATEDQWVKAVAVDAGAAATGADILVVADADVWTDGISAAVDAVAAGAPWAVPHRRVHRLTQESTSHVLAGRPLGGPTVQPPYRGHLGGGIVVLPRTTYLDVPLDPRFVGWGQEDDAWAVALNTLAGAPWAGAATLWHLWHPPQHRQTRQVGSEHSRRLLDRYLQARRNQPAIRALIDESRVSR